MMQSYIGIVCLGAALLGCSAGANSVQGPEPPQPNQAEEASAAIKDAPLGVERSMMPPGKPRIMEASSIELPLEKPGGGTRGAIDALEALVVQNGYLDVGKGLVKIKGEVLGDQMAVMIPGGKRNCDWTAVGAVQLDGSMNCTGTLISRRTVLTAAHCIENANGSKDRLDFFLGCERGIGKTFKVKEAWTPTERVPQNPEHDIGVLCLTKIPDVNPMVLPSEEHSAAWYEDRALWFVGFGLFDPKDPNSFGVRRDAAMRVRNVGNFTFEYGGNTTNTCYIDSGGPSLDGNIVIGVTSKGDERCRRYGVDTRVDRHLRFIEEKMTACER